MDKETQVVNRKRLRNNNDDIEKPIKIQALNDNNKNNNTMDDTDDHHDSAFTDLTLAPFSPPPRHPSPPRPPPPPKLHTRNPFPWETIALVQPLKKATSGQKDYVPAPFRWAADSFAKVQPLSFLINNQVLSIRGNLECKKCRQQVDMEFNLMDKFLRVWKFMTENNHGMCQRAPERWLRPILPNCEQCFGVQTMKPVLPNKNEEINWLFLFLGEFLGCCSLNQLKFFCQWTGNHRTGAKDRLLYLTYVDLCKQLYGDGRFNQVNGGGS
ncbi:hypothetical protein ACFE04_001461 [Oxalis oulophora]